MLKPSRVAIAGFNVKMDAPILLQSGLEVLVGRMLEGKIQSGLVYGSWGEESVLYGYYSPYDPALHAGGLKGYRRVTGGPPVRMGRDTLYVGLVFASESLVETAELGSRLASCLDGDLMGATRFGPRELAAGVVEIAAPEGADIVGCVSHVLGVPPSGFSRLSVGGEAVRIGRAYSHPGWVRFQGVKSMPRTCTYSFPGGRVRLGVALSEEKYIVAARIEGDFNAAPPNGPFNLVSSIEGMPAGDTVVDAFNVRAEATVEWLGVDIGGLTSCFSRLLHDE
ncbi:MAG: hypothetical protein LRS48_03025 [Desulfurococcales archaeon]|nr:hypothetical protein [Desulfurococcales archaeon]